MRGGVGMRCGVVRMGTTGQGMGNEACCYCYLHLDVNSAVFVVQVVLQEQVSCYGVCGRKDAAVPRSVTKGFGVSSLSKLCSKLALDKVKSQCWIFDSAVMCSSTTYHLAVFPLLSRQLVLCSLVNECVDHMVTVTRVVVLGTSKDCIRDFLGDSSVSFALNWSLLLVLAVGSYRAVNFFFHGGALLGHLCRGFLVQIIVSTELMRLLVVDGYMVLLKPDKYSELNPESFDSPVNFACNPSLHSFACSHWVLQSSEFLFSWRPCGDTVMDVQILKFQSLVNQHVILCLLFWSFWCLHCSLDVCSELFLLSVLAAIAQGSELFFSWSGRVFGWFALMFLLPSLL
ncbi:hypothetical protein MTR67_001707 [Solanum verrucosum]|uniref:Uncharacterized protein n=1 Tax=Solanum verrucosum TaxID=315347 RepID=A0AAF0PP33_SOLVR|nr:hypothetical protein MTR67_001707 [Solanum verrucosum]